MLSRQLTQLLAAARSISRLQGTSIKNRDDRVLTDYLFQKASDNPTLGKDIRVLRKKNDILISDGGYSISKREAGANRSLRNIPVMIHHALVGSKIEKESTNSIIRNIETAGAFELKRWIHSYCPSAEVLDRDWLRQEIAKEINEAAGLY